MSEVLTVSDIRFERAPEGLRGTGLFGFVRLVLNDSLVIDGIQIRSTRDGRTIVSWPERTGRRGRHCIVHPRDAHAGASLDGDILATLRGRGDLT